MEVVLDQQSVNTDVAEGPSLFVAIYEAGVPGPAGAGLTGLVPHAVVVGSGTGIPAQLPVGTNGQVVIGQSGADPAWHALSGDIGSITAGGAVTIADAAITLAKMADLPGSTVIGNATGSATAPQALDASDLTTLLGLGTAAFAATGDFDAAGTALTAAAAALSDADDYTDAAIAALGAMASQGRTASGGDITGTWPALNLPVVGSAAGPIGDGTHVAQVTIDTKGRVTALASVAITGAVPSGNAGGDLTGTYPDPTLAATAVTAASYGDSTHVATFTVDAKGRLTAAASTAIALVATGDATGTLPGALTLATSGVSAAQYGDAANVAQVTFDAKGRATAAANVAIAIGGAAITSGTVAFARLPTGTGASNVAAGGVITAGGPQGDAAHTQVLTWNAAGQLTAVTNTAIAVDAAAITSGTIPFGQLPTGTGSSNVVAGGVITGAGPQGDASHTQVLTWNAAGQLTTVTNTAIALAGSAITSGTVDIARLSTGTGVSNVVLGGTITAGGPTGDASHVAQVTYNAAGQLTTVASVSIAVSAAAVTSGTLDVARGGTGVSSPAAHVLLIGNGSSAMTALTTGTAGQLLIGQGTTSDPAWASLGTDATLSSAGALTIAAAAVTLAKMANLAANTIIGNNTGSGATPIALTRAQVLAMLSANAGAAFDWNAQDLTNIGALTATGATLSSSAPNVLLNNTAQMAAGATITSITGQGLDSSNNVITGPIIDFVVDANAAWATLAWASRIEFWTTSAAGASTIRAAIDKSGTFHVAPTITNNVVASSTVSITALGAVTAATVVTSGTGNVTVGGSVVITNDGSATPVIQAGTTNGLKIGSGTTQKLGFWNATPVTAKTGWGTPSGTLLRSALANPTYTTTGGTGQTAGAFDSAAHRDNIITDLFTLNKTVQALITDLKSMGLIQT